MVGVWPVCRCASGGNAGGGVLRLLSAIWCISSVLVNWLSGGGVWGGGWVSGCVLEVVSGSSEEL